MRSHGSTQASPPPHLIRRIDDLRQCLTTARDFSVPFMQFDERLAALPELLDCSEPRRHSLIGTALGAAAKKILPGTSILHALMLEVRGTGFWHGTATMAQGQLMFFYFEEASIGLAALHGPPLRGGTPEATHFLRFSTIDPQKLPRRRRGYGRGASLPC